LLAGSLCAQDRVALLITNTDDARHKRPPVSRQLDALDLALRKADFSVTLKHNVKDFRRELESFNLS